jgi:hypothetical protein
LRYPSHISEKASVTFKAGFPNPSGGVTYFGDKIDIVVGPSNAASDQSSIVNDNTSQKSNPKESEVPKV